MLTMHDGVAIPGSNGAVGRVLLVEDDEVQREGMAQWLRDDGLVVDECSTVEQAVARYQCQEFDVVVTDLRLHGGSGLDLIRQIRETDDCAGNCHNQSHPQLFQVQLPTECATGQHRRETRWTDLPDRCAGQWHRH